MGLAVVGVGFGRTGTNSLKLALEQLLGGRCHHMFEVAERSDELIPLWMAAAAGSPDWDAVFAGDVATVDWPGTAFWRELVDAYPHAMVLLSMRETPEAWWASASSTIFPSIANARDMDATWSEWFDQLRRLLGAQGVVVGDEVASLAAYRRHIDEVRATVPPSRLIEWTTGDGWGPLCEALDIAVPDEPFPHVNARAEFRERADLEDTP